MNEPLSPLPPEQVDELLSAELDGEFDAAATDLGFSPDDARARLDATPNVDAPLIGNSKTHLYHRSTCTRLRQMAENHRVILSSPDDAAAKKFEPCQSCNPPAKSSSPTQFDSSSGSH